MFWNLKDILSRFYNSCLNLIFEKKCIACNCAKADNLLCKTCAKDVQYLSGFPHRIYKEIPVYSATLYQTTVKDLIHNLKFKHKKIASVALAQILYDYFKKIKEDNKNYVLCYVPSFYLKSAQRGYSHMFLIGKEFSKLSGIELNSSLIKKTKFTHPQYQVKNRYENIKNSFKINKKEIDNINNKTIILLDDITTSGATLEEIINCFLKNNVKDIVCLTVTKAI